jgi:ribonuclease HI
LGNQSYWKEFKRTIRTKRFSRVFLIFMQNKIIAYIDGASKGNPGAAGCGVLLVDTKGVEIERIGTFIGRATNNIAEYTALKIAIDRVLEMGIDSLAVYSDSELLTKQINKIYRIKNPELAQIAKIIFGLIAKLDHFKITHIRREKNKIADLLASGAALSRSNVRLASNANASLSVSPSVGDEPKLCQHSAADPVLCNSEKPPESSKIEIPFERVKIEPPLSVETKPNKTKKLPVPTPLFPDEMFPPERS